MKKYYIMNKGETPQKAIDDHGGDFFNSIDEAISIIEQAKQTQAFIIDHFGKIHFEYGMFEEIKWSK